MVAMTNIKYVFILILCGAVAPVCAAEPVKDERVLELVAKRFWAATRKLGEVIETCEAQLVELNRGIFPFWMFWEKNR